MRFGKIKRGFTLIELLVVIAIIGLLSSIVLASINQARIKALGTTFGQNVKQLQLALQFYIDSHGIVPADYSLDNQGEHCVTNFNNIGQCDFNTSLNFYTILQPLIADKDISALPKPPVDDIDFVYNTMMFPSYSNSFVGIQNGEYYTCGSQPVSNYALEVRTTNVTPSITTQTFLASLGLPRMLHVRISNGIISTDAWDGSYCVTNY